MDYSEYNYEREVEKLHNKNGSGAHEYNDYDLVISKTQRLLILY